MTYQTASEIIAERDALKEQVASLKRFAVAMLENWPLGDVDGGELQDEAVKQGLLVPTHRTKPCSNACCNCEEYYSHEEWAEGITCYRKARWLSD